MNKIDLIIDALEKAKDGWQSFDEYEKALAAARELRELKPWVGLTNDEINDFSAGCHLGNSVQGAIRKAEAALRSKNNG